MTKRITTGKRDREKLKEQKRKEKQQKKEERQSSGVSSFDEMIAYVDEYGVLHSTPPEKQKEEIDVSAISISIPKQEDVEESLPLKGRVEHYNSSKGYGFVKDIAKGEKYFFHISAAPPQIAEGDLVTFQLERGSRGMNAVDIVIVNKEDSLPE